MHPSGQFISQHLSAPCLLLLLLTILPGLGHALTSSCLHLLASVSASPYIPTHTDTSPNIIPAIVPQVSRESLRQSKLHNCSWNSTYSTLLNPSSDFQQSVLSPFLFVNTTTHLMSESGSHLIVLFPLVPASNLSHGHNLWKSSLSWSVLL